MRPNRAREPIVASGLRAPAAQAQGAIVVLEWDGDDISRTLGEALADYRSRQSWAAGDATLR